MSHRINNGEGRDSDERQPLDNIEQGGTGSTHSVPELEQPNSRTKHTSHDDSTPNEFLTPDKNEIRNRKSGGVGSNSSNSSNSISSGDNQYSADCSGDGGSDDNQSSDDTSGKPKQPHAMMLDSSAMVAHHQHQQQLHHHKHYNKSHKYDNNTSSSSSSTDDDDDDDEIKMRDKDKSRTTFSTKPLVVGHIQRNHLDGMEQAQQQLSLLSTNHQHQHPAITTIGAAFNHLTSASHHNKSISTSGRMDPQIDLSLVNHIPSSSLILPLHATATAALLQWNHPSNHSSPPDPSNVLESHSVDDSSRRPSIPLHNTNMTTVTSPNTLSNPSENSNGVPVVPILTVDNYVHLMEVRTMPSNIILYVLHDKILWFIIPI